MGGGVELQRSRLTGATDKTEAMLDQQPKTNQVKQPPHGLSGYWPAEWRTSESLEHFKSTAAPNKCCLRRF